MRLATFLYTGHALFIHDHSDRHFDHSHPSFPLLVFVHTLLFVMRSSLVCWLVTSADGFSLATLRPMSRCFTSPRPGKNACLRGRVFARDSGLLPSQFATGRVCMRTIGKHDRSCPDRTCCAGCACPCTQVAPAWLRASLACMRVRGVVRDTLAPDRKRALRTLIMLARQEPGFGWMGQCKEGPEQRGVGVVWACFRVLETH